MWVMIYASVHKSEVDPTPDDKKHLKFEILVILFKNHKFEDVNHQNLILCHTKISGTSEITSLKLFTIHCTTLVIKIK